MTTLKRAKRTVMALAALTFFSNNSFAEKIELTPEDGKTAQMVASMVASRHINHPQIDDALSEKLLKRYIEVWDPQKL